VGFVVLRSEDKPEKLNRPADAIHQIKLVLTNKGLMLATGFIFLVGVEPGFDTPLFYYQTDALHFTPQFLGWLALVRGILGLIGATLYGFLCKRFTLKWLLILVDHHDERDG
jgi:predicted MFS family arabinose efflux permease